MMRLSQAASVLHGELLGDDSLFTAVSKDTRTIAQGDLYVALKGERFDGHAFVAEAGAAGAVGALVSEQQPIALPQVRVDDTRLALGQLAASWREHFTGKLVGITGSNGKTTVKEMCRSIFANAAGDAQVLSTAGNLNNDIGMPMTLLSIREQHRYAVIEMGANHAGEIDYLTHIARPDVAVITNAGPAHLEGFGSIEGVAHAKAEIYRGLGDDGIAVINFDDDYADYWRQCNAGRAIMGFSMKTATADVYAQAQDDARWLLHTPAGETSITLPLPGQHNVMNALAAASLALAAGVELTHVVDGLEHFTGVPGRLAFRKAANGAVIIDDSYNANPQSLNAAIDVLATKSHQGWLVLGDMAELGDDAHALHAAAGRRARQQGVARLYAVGEHSRSAVEAFGEGGRHFGSRDELLACLDTDMEATSVILVKGSRAMAMDRVVAALIADGTGNNKNNNTPGVN